MKSIGIIVTHLGASQLAFTTIKQCDLIKKEGWSPFIFYKVLYRPCINPTCVTMNVCEAYSFNSHCIATSLDDAKILSEANCGGKRIFYIWDLEWLRRGKKDFDYNTSIYRDERLTLIARSQEHAKAIENYSNRKVNYIIENLNVSEIIKLCNLQ